MNASDDQTLSPEASMVTVDHMFDLWVYPELVRRGIEPIRENVRSAVVILKRDEAPRVLLSGEIMINARVRATRAIKRGEAITAADIGDVESFVPADLDDDAAWIAFIVLPDGRAFLGFDFRYDLGKARVQMDRAEDFMVTAESALERGALAPAIDNALSAAELAVVIQMRQYVQQDADRRDRHGARYRWFDGWTQLGNAAERHAKALRRMAQLRGWARYAEADAPGPRNGEAARLCRAARELVDETRIAVTRWTDEYPFPSLEP